MTEASIKKRVIQLCSTLPEEEPLKNNKIVLLTSSSFIEGTLFSISPDSTEQVSKAYEIAYAAGRGILEGIKSFDFKPSSGDDGYIALKDVRVRHFSTLNIIQPMPFLIVFYDQIVGVTLGNFDEQ